MGSDIIYKLLAGYVVFVWYSANFSVFGVKFKLLTSYNRNGREVNVEELRKGSINPLKRVIMLAAAKEYGELLSESYLEKDNYNVFAVEWSGTTDDAGNEVGLFLDKIFNATGERYLDIHLNGVENGSEVCRKAAEEVLKLAGRKVNRLTEIQPTNFESDSGKADFVDVVSCAKAAGTGVMGGNVDFYIADKKEECNTKTLVDLFAKSISTNNMKANGCEDYATFILGKCEDNEKIIFGENVNKTAKGNFFFDL